MKNLIKPVNLFLALLIRQLRNIFRGVLERLERVERRLTDDEIGSTTADHPDRVPGPILSSAAPAHWVKKAESTGPPAHWLETIRLKVPDPQKATIFDVHLAPERPASGPAANDDNRAADELQDVSPPNGFVNATELREDAAATMQRVHQTDNTLPDELVKVVQGATATKKVVRPPRTNRSNWLTLIKSTVQRQENRTTRQPRLPSPKADAVTSSQGIQSSPRTETQSSDKTVLASIALESNPQAPPTSTPTHHRHRSDSLHLQDDSLGPGMVDGRPHPRAVSHPIIAISRAAVPPSHHVVAPAWLPSVQVSKSQPLQTRQTTFVNADEQGTSSPAMRQPEEQPNPVWPTLPGTRQPSKARVEGFFHLPAREDGSAARGSNTSSSVNLARGHVWPDLPAEAYPVDDVNGHLARQDSEHMQRLESEQRGPT